MIWTDSNRLFNDAFFTMIHQQPSEQLFPIWKKFSFKNLSIDQLLEVKEKLDLSIDLDPDFYKAYFLKGIVQRNLNLNDESITCFQNVKDNDFYLYACNIYLAEYYIHKLKFDQALLYLDEVYKIYNANPRIVFLLALVHIELFQLDEGKRYLNQLSLITKETAVIQLLLFNLQITQQIIQHTTNRLVLKNFKLKSINYNLQLKTNLIHHYNWFQEQGMNYDAINCFIHALILKNITAYPKFTAINSYSVHQILNYLQVQNHETVILFDSINFEHDFIKTYEEYLEVEAQIREDL